MTMEDSVGLTKREQHIVEEVRDSRQAVMRTMSMVVCAAAILGYFYQLYAMDARKDAKLRAVTDKYQHGFSRLVEKPGISGISVEQVASWHQQYVEDMTQLIQEMRISYRRGGLLIGVGAVVAMFFVAGL